MKKLLKTFWVFVESVRSSLIIIKNFVIWCFTNKASMALFMILTLAAGSWAGGFLVFVKDIDQTRGELVADSPDFGNTTDAIVVLTGGSERIKHAIYMLNLGFAKKLFISGVNKEVKLNQLLALHGYNTEQQAAMQGRIDLGYQANDTIDNANEIAAWVKQNNFQSIRLVTSNYHIKRAMLEMQNAMPDVKIIPHGVVPINIRIDRWWAFSATRKLLISEYDKYLAANFRIFLENLHL